MRSTVRIALVTLFCIGWLVGSARGQNILANGSFNTSLASWTTLQPFEAAVWQPLDANGSPSSGSASLTNTFSMPAPSGGGSLEQCVPITGGASYDFGAKVQIPSGQANTGFVQITVGWYSAPACNGFLSTSFTNAGGLTGVWQSAGLAAVPAPGGAASAVFLLAHFKNEAGGSFVTYFDDAYLRPAVAPTGLLTLPSITSVHGANQTFFHSDVWILNRSFTNALDITLRYRCFTGLPCAAAPQVVSLPPRESRLFSDIVFSTFGSPETAGALEIGWNASLGELTANSRLYTPELPSPTSGFSLPAVPPDQARTRAVFIGLGSNGGDLTQGFRTNAGAYNPNASSVTVTFTLHAASGAVLGSPHARTYGPFEPIQINDIFNVVGAGSTVATDAYLVVSTNGLPVFPYVAVIDNKSGDSVWVIPSDDEAP
jgi:hypothetical protein